MVVTPKARSRHLGRRLGEEAVARARAMGFSTILLETNSSLEPALALYRSLGFEDIELDPGPEFERADVRMRLTLGNNGAAT